MVHSSSLLALAAASFIPVHAIDLDVNSADSIRSAASTIAKGLVGNYHGTDSGHAVGVLDEPYFWWEAGAMFDTLIEYWRSTGDDQYNGIVSQALAAQKGPDGNFMPPNQTAGEGNDDQATWALAAMSAAEAQLPAPSGSSWVSLAEGVFDAQAIRWDTENCAGGLRWMIYPFANGYNYKNNAANGHFFELAARLAHFTNNNTYSDWASKVFDWSVTAGYIDADWRVFDGAHIEKNCTDISKTQWSLYAGTYVSGAAYMYNITSGDAQSQWKKALDGLLKQTMSTFFPNGIATETACEPQGICTTDMKAMKGLLAQRLADTISVAPYTSQTISPLFQSSALAAAKSCSDTGCKFAWSGNGTQEDSLSGVGEQLDALSFVQALLLRKSTDKGAPTTTTTGGTPSTNGTNTASGSQTNTSGTGIPPPPKGSVCKEY
ncbi:glycoside hydrolase family 76 protein [Xylogone sp. PMI_703]|nr:glycoside hydrolase family 76 protein [Xylogone sp. PMI_703]